MTTPFQILKAEAMAQSLPKSYTDDLNVHDRATLAKQDPALPFAWVLHACGTHLYVQAEAKDPHELPGRQASYRGNISRAMAFFAAQVGYLFYWWDGATLSRVTPQEATQRLLEVEVDFWGCDCSACRRLQHEARQRENG